VPISTLGHRRCGNDARFSSVMFGRLSITVKPCTSNTQLDCRCRATLDGIDASRSAATAVLSAWWKRTARRADLRAFDPLRQRVRHAIGKRRDGTCPNIKASDRFATEIVRLFRFITIPSLVACCLGVESNRARRDDQHTAALNQR
jgi:hypothetical protein